MSITRQVTVWCDDCGAWDQASDTASALRSAMKKNGWTRVKRNYRIEDLCPDCTKKLNFKETEP